MNLATYNSSPNWIAQFPQKAVDFFHRISGNAPYHRCRHLPAAAIANGLYQITQAE